MPKPRRSLVLPGALDVVPPDDLQATAHLGFDLSNSSTRQTAAARRLRRRPLVKSSDAIPQIGEDVHPAETAVLASGQFVRASGRTAEVVAFERLMVEFFIDAVALIGAPKSIGAIYGIIFASPTPVGFAEIQHSLNISTGSLSQGLKALKTVGAIKAATSADHRLMGIQPLHPASTPRRDFYIPNLEARKLVAAWLDQKLQRHLEAGSRRLRQILLNLPSSRSGTLVASRLDHLKNWHDKAQAILPVAKEFLNSI